MLMKYFDERKFNKVTSEKNGYMEFKSLRYSFL